MSVSDIPSDIIVKGEATSIEDMDCILYFNMGCLADTGTSGWIKNTK